MKKNVPNILSVCRVAAAVAMLTAMMLINVKEKRLMFTFVPGIIFGLGCLTDMLDGKIARRYDIVSDFGKFVDPIGDKILIFFAMLGFVYVGADEKFPFMFIALAVTLLREFIVSSVRMMFASEGRVMAANIYGKIKTVSQMAALILYFVFIGTKYIVIAQVLLFVCVITTVISGGIYLSEFVKSQREKTNDKNSL